MTALATRLLAKTSPEPNSGCWLWEGAVSNGYGVIRKPYGSNVRAHRAVYEAFVGPIPDSVLVRHRCDVPLCVNPDHLVLGSHADNMADRVRSNARKLGRKVGLSSEEAELLVRLAKRGASFDVLADQFRIARSWVPRIVRAWDARVREAA